MPLQQYVNLTVTGQEQYQLYERTIVSGVLIKKGAGSLLHSDQLNHLDTKQISSELVLCSCRINSISTAYLLLGKVDVGADS